MRRGVSIRAIASFLTVPIVAVPIVDAMNTPAIERNTIGAISFVTAQRQSECRKITSEGVTPFYRSLPNANSQFGVLQSGEKIGLGEGGDYSQRAPDGRYYIRVYTPYGSNNPTVGYIPYETRLASCGGRKARW